MMTADAATTGVNLPVSRLTVDFYDNNLLMQDQYSITTGGERTALTLNIEKIIKGANGAPDLVKGSFSGSIKSVAEYQSTGSATPVSANGSFFFR